MPNENAKSDAVPAEPKKKGQGERDRRPPQDVAGKHVKSGHAPAPKAQETEETLHDEGDVDIED